MPLKITYTVMDRKDCTPAVLWSKTTGGVDGTWEDPPTSKFKIERPLKRFGAWADPLHD